jgi:exopolyphosphatase / guanosine-5'-triphosphate,3'-diphosphate pyrophosphatase
LREGLLSEMLARLNGHDVRDHTITGMLQRYRMDSAHARQVAETAVQAWDAIALAWGLDEQLDTRDYLRWAACLHEIGLAISHSQHHRHGAYVLENADMAGFSRDDQAMLSVLTRLQRKRLTGRYQHQLASRHRDTCLPVACLLRVAIILNRAREAAPHINFDAPGPRHWSVAGPPGWLRDHPLLADDLADEVAAQRAAGIRLDLGGDG